VNFLDVATVKTLQDSLGVVSGDARPSILSHDRCHRRTLETKPCESGVVESHFHSEEELQVELYSCGCCEGDDHCPHGYGYGIVDVDDYLNEQSTIFHRSEDESDDGSIKNTSIPVRLTKNQKKNLKRRAKRKLIRGDHGDNIELPPTKKLQPKVIRRNVRNYKKWEFEISSLQGDKAKKQGCTIAHLLSNQELDNLKKKGMVILHVTKPYYPKLKTGKIAKEIYWSMVGSVPPQVFEGPLQESVVIVTTYDQV